MPKYLVISAGYSLCAIGTALMLGFVIPLNFRAPFAAHGFFRDFWRRWHISLSSWLEIISTSHFGGNRKGKILTFRNLMITMFLAAYGMEQLGHL